MNLRKVTIKSNEPASIRCPICTRKHTESLKPGTRLNCKCVKCGWEFEFEHLKPYQERKSKTMVKK